MKARFSFSLACAFGLMAPVAQAADVAVSIAPLHSLVSSVMKGVDEPYLLIKGSQSPHTYQLKPSDVKALQKSKAVFWVGEELETFLERPLKNLSAKAEVVALENAHGLTFPNATEDKGHEKHHDDHHEDHDDHDEHHAKVKGYEEHGHEGHHDDHEDDHHDNHKDDHHDEEGHDDHHGHNHGDKDMHIWLDPLNAKAMVHEIEETLSKIDPKNAPIYKENAEKLEHELEGLIHEIEAILDPVHEKPFIVFHDAYKHFEKRFHINVAGKISVSPEKLPGAKRLKEVRHAIEHENASCVFAEPQFKPKLVETVVAGTGAKSAVLDPLGSELTPGSDLYANLMRNLALSIKGCLSS